MINGEIKIGTKPTVEYVLAALHQLKRGEKMIVFLARGRMMSKAIDVYEILKHQSIVKSNKIATDTETFENNNKCVNISAIKITVIY